MTTLDSLEHGPDTTGHRGLTGAQLGISCTLLVAMFLLVEGPMWRHPWNLEVVNTAILLSYAPVPILVLACLAWSKRLGWTSFFLEVLRLTLLKYGVTFSIALVFWTLTDAPRAAIAAHPAPRAPAATPASPPVAGASTAVTRTGTLRGRVLADGDTPRSNTLVYVASGLEGYAFDTPSEPVTLLDDGAQVVPRVAAVMVHQTILARSSDGHLHTLVADVGGESLFHVPAMRSGTSSRVVIDEPHGPARVSCALHPGRERPARLVVLTHPFATTTDADGRFELARVPRGRLTVAALREDAAGPTTATVELDAEAELTLHVPVR